jgi:YbgC/YbaW family acyl-CoA thioester hydrolase
MPRAMVRVRVPFVDVDSSQRIHFTAWFRYMEVAEHELMRQLGLPYASGLLEQAFPRVHLECDFHSAIVYDDLLEVEARVERVGRRSWTVACTARKVNEQQLVGSDTEEPVATGRMTIVAMDPETERSITLPEVLRKAFSDA